MGFDLANWAEHAHTRTHSYWRPRGHQYPLMLFLRTKSWKRTVRVHMKAQDPGKYSIGVHNVLAAQSPGNTAFLRQNPGNYSIPWKIQHLEG